LVCASHEAKLEWFRRIQHSIDSAAAWLGSPAHTPGGGTKDCPTIKLLVQGGGGSALGQVTGQGGASTAAVPTAAGPLPSSAQDGGSAAGASTAITVPVLLPTKATTRRQALPPNLAFQSPMPPSHIGPDDSFASELAAADES
jgi:hypothetical protein